MDLETSQKYGFGHIPCYYNRFGGGPPCEKPAVWRSIGCNNMTDGWTWCDEHSKDDPEFRERIPVSAGEGK
jgi:hypothetical protein